MEMPPCRPRFSSPSGKPQPPREQGTTPRRLNLRFHLAVDLSGERALAKSIAKRLRRVQVLHRAGRQVMKLSGHRLRSSAAALSRTVRPA